MIKKITVIILGLFLLSGCEGFRDNFKKSANNKMIDRKGFQGGKRKPLYNRKYISLAKRNIVEENFDEDEEEIDDLSEIRNPSQENRKMYMNMIRRDAERKERKRLEEYKSSYKYNDADDDRSYPSLAKSNKKVKQEDLSDQKLQKELSEIKSMLNEAKKDLVKYKCPMGQNIDETKAQHSSSDDKEVKIKSKILPNSPQKVVDHHEELEEKIKTGNIETSNDKKRPLKHQHSL